MSTTTPRLGLYQPEDDGSEPINVATDLNDNLERIDSGVGFVPSTSAVPPATPFDGMATYETDTNVAKFRKAATSAWVQLLSAGSIFANHLLINAANRIGIGVASSPTAMVDAIVANIFTFPFAKYKASGEPTHRLEINHDGIRIGGGQVAPETRIYRPSPSQLAVTGNTTFENNVNVTGTTGLAATTISGSLNLGGNVVTDLNVTGNITATGTGYSKIVKKVNDEPRTSTTTATIDPDLYVDLPANSTYLLEAFLFISGTTGDVKTSWNIPAAATMFRWALGPDVGATSNSNVTMRTSINLATSEPAYGLFSETSWSGASETCVVTLGATAGRVQLKFAQNTSSAVSTILRNSSFMRITKIA